MYYNNCKFFKKISYLWIIPVCPNNFSDKIILVRFFEDNENVDWSISVEISRNYRHDVTVGNLTLLQNKKQNCLNVTTLFPFIESLLSRVPWKHNKVEYLNIKSSKGAKWILLSKTSWNWALLLCSCLCRNILCISILLNSKSFLLLLVSYLRLDQRTDDQVEG